MLRWILRKWRAARTWLVVRLGLARGRWQRGAARPPLAPLLPTVPFGRWPVHAWRYGLYCPPGLDDSDAAPLFVLLHGCHQSALRFAVATGWTCHADRAKVRLLCPDQRRRANPLGCWNWFMLPAQSGAGELAVVLNAIDQVAARCAIAPHPIAAIGLSAGGAMAALLAFHHPGRIAAAVAVAAPPILGPTNLQDPRDVIKHGLRVPPAVAVAALPPCAPLLVVHGELDDVVDPVCGRQLIAQAVTSHYGATASPDSTTNATARIVDYRSRNRLIARHAVLPELRHHWTGGPGGHAYCEAGGPSLVALATRFLSDV
jgi:poly(hydroxyalkanoate) depolymerase family esterase